MRRLLPLKKARGRLDNPRLTLVPLPNCMKTGLGKPRLTGEEGNLHKQHSHAGQAHPLSMSMKPRKSGGAELYDELARAELNFHDVLLWSFVRTSLRLANLFASHMPVTHRLSMEINYILIKGLLFLWPGLFAWSAGKSSSAVDPMDDSS